MRFESAEFQPLPGKVFDERTRLRILQHPLNLRREYCGLSQRSFIGEFKQLVVGCARPQEIRHSRCQCVLGDRQNAGCCDGTGFLCGFAFLYPEQEVGRNEDRLDAGCNSVIVGRALLTGRRNQIHVGLQFSRGDRSAECAARELRPQSGDHKTQRACRPHAHK